MKSKILVIGGTGYIGRHLVQASVKAGHPTFALVRESSLSNPSRSDVVAKLENLGVTFVTGDLLDHQSLVNGIKQADVVISAVGHAQLADQDKVVDAILEAGNVKRFFPSEFGYDPDRNNTMEPVKSAFATKIKLRRRIEAEGIPYTYVVSNFFAGNFLSNLAQPGATSPPREEITIFGDGNTKAVFTKEEDIAEYAIKAVDDPRLMNKTLYIRCPSNILSLNDLATIWEAKIGKKLEKLYIPEDQLVKKIQETPLPLKAILSVLHGVFINGDQTNFEIEESFGLEASNLYPEVRYTTADEYLSQLV